MSLWNLQQKGKGLWWERGKGEEIPKVCQFKFQAAAYPWIAALLRDEDIEAEYINSKCGAVLVSTSTINNLNLEFGLPWFV